MTTSLNKRLAAALMGATLACSFSRHALADEPLRVDLASAAATDPQAITMPGLSMGGRDPSSSSVSLAALADLSTPHLLRALPGLDPEAGAGGGDGWWFQPSLSIWLPGISGDIGVRRLTVHVSADFADVLSNSDSVIGLTGALQLGKGKLGGYVSGSFMKVGAEAGPNGRIDVTNEITLVEFGLSYEIGRWAMAKTATADHPARDLTLTLTAGGRYTDVSVDFDFDVLPDRSASVDWVDPMVGARVVVPLSQHVSLVGGGEVGGFGVASDFAWSAAGLISWDFYIKQFPSALQVGYLAVGDEYSTGSGRSCFEWDTVLHGLLFNFTMRF